MDTLIQANIFFFITSLAVIAVSFFVVLLLIRLRRLFKSLNNLVDKLNNTADFVSDEAKDLMSDIKESAAFRFIFPKSKKRKRSSAEDSQDKSSPRKIRRKV